MAHPRNPQPAASGSEVSAAVAGLAREVEGLRRAVDAERGVSARVDDLARTVTQLADALSAVTARPGPTPAPSWLLAPVNEAHALAVLDELAGWLHAVFLRYPDGAGVLPGCWLYHPDVVEELLWLMHAWLAAYQGKTAAVALAGDWHDRQRPGVVRRIRASAGSCSAEKHRTRSEWDQQPTGAVSVPGVDTVGSIAAWWATARDDPAPEPAEQHTPAPVPSGFATNGAHPR